MSLTKNYSREPCISVTKCWRVVYRTRKKSFSLIEVVISFVLISCITLSLVSLYMTLSTASLSMEMRIAASEKRLERQRTLRRYLSSIITASTRLTGKGSAQPFFMTEGANGTSHYIVYTALNNGVDPNPSLSNEVLGMFSLDQSGSLILTLKTHPARADVFRTHETSMIVWESIERLEWEFGIWPSGTRKGRSSGKDTAPIDEPPEGQWLREWRREWKNKAPSMIRLKIIEKSGSTETVTAVQPQAIHVISL